MMDVGMKCRKRLVNRLDGWSSMTAGAEMRLKQECGKSGMAAGNRKGESHGQDDS